MKTQRNIQSQLIEDRLCARKKNKKRTSQVRKEGHEED